MQYLQRLTLLLVPALMGWSLLSGSLAEVHQQVIAAYPTVSHIEAKTLLELPPEQVLLFDVREPEEYQISHLKGAIQLSPETPASTLHEIITRYHSDHTLIVFYCAVGYRSAKMAALFESTSNKENQLPARNLAEGLFGWHNRGYPMENAAGSTREIHPYSLLWQRFLQTPKNADTKKAP